ncbi:MAG TPA: protein-disulfide reductase DsbD domain-containing protein [Candidatus Sulfotelmatobacter sp.]
MTSLPNSQSPFSGKKNRRVPALWAASFAIFLTASAAAQAAGDATVTITPNSPPVAGKVPSVVVAPVALVTAPRAAQTMVNLDFRVPRGYHINSNTPKSEFLIPTALKMDLPTDIILGKIQYPEGQDLTFPFSPDEKLNVYTGDFRIVVAVHPLLSVTPGKYIMHGVLRYQACDNSACYPPKSVRVEFNVKVVKEPAQHHANPAQSPHVHG